MKYERGEKEINIEEESGLCQRESSRAIRCVTDEAVWGWGQRSTGVGIGMNDWWWGQAGQSDISVKTWGTDGKRER